MSEDTISRIKLRLNNNIRSKQSKSQAISALSNRMSATDYSACNDFFANCCDCCGLGCNCCPCLSGFWITVTGWENGGDCECEGLNGGPVWAPRHIIDDASPTTSCYQGGQVPGFRTFGIYTCPPSDRERTSLHWALSCVNGKLILSVSTGSRLVEALNGTLSHGVVASLSIEVENCDSLAVDEIVTCRVGAGSPDCICPSGIRIQTFPVFYEQLPATYPPLPLECQCCKPVRCEVEEPGCLNPYPDTLTLTFTDNCLGPSSILLGRVTNFGMGLCWQGLYNVICPECEFGYRVGVLLCCQGGHWFIFFSPVNNYDDFIWDNIFEGYGTQEDAVSRMYFDSCDPLSFHSSEMFCKTATVNCPGPIGASYCVTSVAITE